MKKYFEILKKCPLFAGIENLEGILACLGARAVSYKKHEFIISEGDSAKYVGIVLLGTVQIEKTDYYGNRSIVASIGEAEMFGESFACADVKNIPVDVVAVTDCEVLLIDCKKIISTCSNSCEFHNRMIYNLLKVMAMKNIEFNRKSEIVSKRTTREKLMTYLLLQAKKTGRESFKIPYDRQELADYLGVDRSGLSAEISKLRNEGVIRCRKNFFEILRQS